MRKSFLLFVLLITFPEKIKTAQGAEEKEYLYGFVAGDIRYLQRDQVNKRKLIECLKELDKKTGIRKDKPTLLVVGSTGVGKTTSILYLLGYRMEKRKRKIYVADWEGGESPIGHEIGGEGKTRGMEIYHRKGSPIAFCDTEGVRGTAIGTATQHCMAHFTPYFVIGTRRIKGICLVTSMRNLIGGRVENYIKAIESISMSFEKAKIGDIKKSIMMIITKTKTEDDREECIDILREVIQINNKKVIKNKKNKNLKPEFLSESIRRKFLLDAFLIKPVPEKEVDNFANFQLNKKKIIFIDPLNEKKRAADLKVIRSLQPIPNACLSSFENDASFLVRKAILEKSCEIGDKARLLRTVKSAIESTSKQISILESLETIEKQNRKIYKLIVSTTNEKEKVQKDKKNLILKKERLQVEAETILQELTSNEIVKEVNTIHAWANRLFISEKTDVNVKEIVSEDAEDDASYISSLEAFVRRSSKAFEKEEARRMELNKHGIYGNYKPNKGVIKLQHLTHTTIEETDETTHQIQKEKTLEADKNASDKDWLDVDREKILQGDIATWEEVTRLKVDDQFSSASQNFYDDDQKCDIEEEGFIPPGWNSNTETGTFKLLGKECILM